MNQLKQAAAIAIIGGADGTTSIYVEKGAVFQLLLPWFLLFALAVFFLVRSILKKRKLGTILSSVFCVIFLFPPAAFFLGNFMINHQSEKWSELKSAALPWNENEIANHFFELDDSETVETFYFQSDSSENRTVTCTFGKKGKMLASPIKCWQIDENGILCIFDDSPEERECIRIEKIRISEDVLYAEKNQRVVKYKYCSEEKSYPLGTDDISELSGMRVQVENGTGLLLYIFDCENGGFEVDRYLCGSGVAIAGKETFFCQADDNTLGINDEEKLVLSDGRLHYFFKDEEFRIISVYSSFMESQIYLFDEIAEEQK